jgi:flagellar biosynthesis anti-sigma factor FlgM
MFNGGMCSGLGGTSGMKISDRKGVSRTTGPATPQRVAPTPRGDAAPREEASGADAVVLSESLHEVDRAKQALAAMPDVRVDRVQDVKPRVQEGTYRIDSQAVAKRLVDTAVVESARTRRKRRA